MFGLWSGICRYAGYRPPPQIVSYSAKPCPPGYLPTQLLSPKTLLRGVSSHLSFHGASNPHNTFLFPSMRGVRRPYLPSSATYHHNWKLHWQGWNLKHPPLWNPFLPSASYFADLVHGLRGSWYALTCRSAAMIASRPTVKDVNAIMDLYNEEVSLDTVEPAPDPEGMWKGTLIRDLAPDIDELFERQGNIIPPVETRKQIYPHDVLTPYEQAYVRRKTIEGINTSSDIISWRTVFRVLGAIPQPSYWITEKLCKLIVNTVLDISPYEERFLEDITRPVSLRSFLWDRLHGYPGGIGAKLSWADTIKAVGLPMVYLSSYVQQVIRDQFDRRINRFAYYFVFRFPRDWAAANYRILYNIFDYTIFYYSEFVALMKRFDVNTWFMENFPGSYDALRTAASKYKRYRFISSMAPLVDVPAIMQEVKSQGGNYEDFLQTLLLLKWKLYIAYQETYPHIVVPRPAKDLSEYKKEVNTPHPERQDATHHPARQMLMDSDEHNELLEEIKDEGYDLMQQNEQLNLTPYQWKLHRFYRRAIGALGLTKKRRFRSVQEPDGSTGEMMLRYHVQFKPYVPNTPRERISEYFQSTMPPLPDQIVFNDLVIDPFGRNDHLLRYRLARHRFLNATPYDDMHLKDMETNPDMNDEVELKKAGVKLAPPNDYDLISHAVERSQPDQPGWEPLRLGWKGPTVDSAKYQKMARDARRKRRLLRYRQALNMKNCPQKKHLVDQAYRQLIMGGDSPRSIREMVLAHNEHLVAKVMETAPLSPPYASWLPSWLHWGSDDDDDFEEDDEAYLKVGNYGNSDKIKKYKYQMKSLIDTNIAPLGNPFVSDILLVDKDNELAQNLLASIDYESDYLHTRADHDPELSEKQRLMIIDSIPHIREKRLMAALRRKYYQYSLYQSDQVNYYSAQRMHRESVMYYRIMDYVEAMGHYMRIVADAYRNMLEHRAKEMSKFHLLVSMTGDVYDATQWFFGGYYYVGHNFFINMVVLLGIAIPKAILSPFTLLHNIFPLLPVPFLTNPVKRQVARQIAMIIDSYLVIPRLILYPRPKGRVTVCRHTTTLIMPSTFIDKEKMAKEVQHDAYYGQILYADLSSRPNDLLMEYFTTLPTLIIGTIGIAAYATTYALFTINRTARTIKYFFWQSLPINRLKMIYYEVVEPIIDPPDQTYVDYLEQEGFFDLDHALATPIGSIPGLWRLISKIFIEAVGMLTLIYDKIYYVNDITDPHVLDALRQLGEEASDPFLWEQGGTAITHDSLQARVNASTETLVTLFHLMGVEDFNHGQRSYDNLSDRRQVYFDHSHHTDETPNEHDFTLDDLTSHKSFQYSSEIDPEYNLARNTADLHAMALELSRRFDGSAGISQSPAQQAEDFFNKEIMRKAEEEGRLASDAMVKAIDQRARARSEHGQHSLPPFIFDTWALEGASETPEEAEEEKRRISQFNLQAQQLNRDIQVITDPTKRKLLQKHDPMANTMHELTKGKDSFVDVFDTAIKRVSPKGMDSRQLDAIKFQRGSAPSQANSPLPRSRTSDTAMHTKHKDTGLFMARQQYGKAVHGPKVHRQVDLPLRKSGGAPQIDE